jgi:hypothetical protein
VMEACLQSIHVEVGSSTIAYAFQSMVKGMALAETSPSPTRTATRSPAIQQPFQAAGVGGPVGNGANPAGVLGGNTMGGFAAVPNLDAGTGMIGGGAAAGGVVAGVPAVALPSASRTRSPAPTRRIPWQPSLIPSSVASAPPSLQDVVVVGAAVGNAATPSRIAKPSPEKIVVNIELQYGRMGSAHSLLGYVPFNTTTGGLVDDGCEKVVGWGYKAWKAETGLSEGAISGIVIGSIVGVFAVVAVVAKAKMVLLDRSPSSRNRRRSPRSMASASVAGCNARAEPHTVPPVSAAMAVMMAEQSKRRSR